MRIKILDKLRPVYYIISMTISRETDYAIRIIRALSRGGRKKIDDICQCEHIPRQFSYKILKKLEKSGMVQISRGAGGGYVLAADTRDLTLFDVFKSIEGDLLLSDCLGHGFDCPMRGRGKGICGVHKELNRIQGLLLGHLREKPLAEILQYADIPA